MTSGLAEAVLYGAGTAALMFAVLLAWRTARRARRRAREAAKTEAERQPERRRELAAKLDIPEADLPELSGWKITPDFACLLVDLVHQAHPRHVLELGSGSSTVLLGLALRGTGAVLTSFEQDAPHAELTRKMLAYHGLGDGIRVENAPLARWPGARDDEPLWYSPETFDRLDAIFGPPWDLVIVDGPSTAGRADARLPALPRLLGKMSESAIVVLDDAARPGERAVVAAWKAMGLLSGFTVQEIPLARGAVVMRRRPAHGTHAIP